MKLEKKFDGVYFVWKGKRKFLLTKNSTPGKIVYGERLFKIESSEYREWIANRSKLAAAIVKGLNIMPIKENSVVLYLGAASGTTVSHISDIANKGFIFALDISPRTTRELLSLCEERNNIAPILADANKPESFKNNITQVDVVYQDLAQKNQVEIFLKNIDLFLKPRGYAIIAIKSRSIDVTKNPNTIFSEVKKQLESKLKILDFRTLEPLEKDHAFFVCQKK